MRRLLGLDLTGTDAFSLESHSPGLSRSAWDWRVADFLMDQGGFILSEAAPDDSYITTPPDRKGYGLQGSHSNGLQGSSSGCPEKPLCERRGSYGSPQALAASGNLEVECAVGAVDAATPAEVSEIDQKLADLFAQEHEDKYM